MTKYASGRNQEWIVKRRLIDAGAFLVTRSAGSKGAADLVAFFDTATYAIQVKRAKPTAAEQADIVIASSKTAATWAVVWSHRGEIESWVYRAGRESKLRVPGL